MQTRREKISPSLVFPFDLKTLQSSLRFFVGEHSIGKVVVVDRGQPLLLSPTFIGAGGECGSLCKLPITTFPKLAKLVKQLPNKASLNRDQAHPVNILKLAKCICPNC